jgi:hypothetical protein
VLNETYVGYLFVLVTEGQNFGKLEKDAYSGSTPSPNNKAF